MNNRRTNLPVIGAAVLVVGFLAFELTQMFVDIGNVINNLGVGKYLPFLAGITAGGLAGNYLYDRGLVHNVRPLTIVSLVFLLLAAIAGDAYFLKHGPAAAFFVAHGLTGFLLAFLPCAGGVGDIETQAVEEVSSR